MTLICAQRDEGGCLELKRWMDVKLGAEIEWIRSGLVGEECLHYVAD